MLHPSFSFLNIFKTNKGMTFSFYGFQLLLSLNVSAKFLAKVLIGSRVLVILSEWYRKILKKKYFVLKQFCMENILSIHYVEVVNMIFFFFHLKSHFLLVFENKCIRIGNFLFFNSKRTEGNRISQKSKHPLCI